MCCNSAMRPNAPTASPASVVEGGNAASPPGLRGNDAAPSDGPSFSPLYRQIKALMTRSLQQREWRPGDAIPSELELAARFKVSQGTVRKAIDELATENLLVRRQGKGTFVATHSEQQAQYRFLRLAADDGSEEPAARRFIDCRRLRAPAEVARAFGLKSGDAAVQVRRVLSFRGKAVIFDDIWLPGKLFKGLSAERLSGYRGPMYALFETEFGVHMVRAEEKIRAVAADPVAAQMLGVEEGSPLLSVERLSLTYGDRPVELRRGLYHTDAHHYRNELN
ncbi:GntR family transcriptional regulator [Piscinibacter sakaiensis]|uniref:GntR family transcriptional regulator n=1 Tax=Piscinibacter sakaiensis TaxID=1547922 RepID=UPI003AAFF618